MMFLYFFGTYQQEISKIDQALKNPFLEGKLTNPLLNIDSFEKLKYGLNFFCSEKFTRILKELRLVSVDHFHVWQFKVKSSFAFMVYAFKFLARKHLECTYTLLAPLNLRKAMPEQGDRPRRQHLRGVPRRLSDEQNDRNLALLPGRPGLHPLLQTNLEF